jgi:hypothetical protein
VKAIYSEQLISSSHSQRLTEKKNYTQYEFYLDGDTSMVILDRTKWYKTSRLPAYISTSTHKTTEGAENPIKRGAKYIQ